MNKKSEKELQSIDKKLIEVLSEESGYFGRVFTWGQRQTKYEFIGYQLTESFYPILERLTPDQHIKLAKVINYFEIHAAPLKKILTEEGKILADLYSPIAWSHFMTVVMFGMLEVAFKDTAYVIYKPGKEKYINKLESTKSFLINNLQTEIVSDVTKRFKCRDKTKLNSFDEVIDYLYSNIRSEFVHDAGIDSLGMEWYEFDGIGTRENPISFYSNVPVQEWLQITWQAILNSFGYTGKLELPKYKD